MQKKEKAFSETSYSDHKAEIDAKNIEEVTSIYGNIDEANIIWKDYSNGSNSLDSIVCLSLKETEKPIINFFANTAPPGPDPTFEKKISPLKTVIVKTNNGRVLFRADRKD